jgi:hypothetical protein
VTGIEQVLPMSWYCTIELYECGVNMICVLKNFIAHYLFILIKKIIYKNTVVPVNIINKWSNEFDIKEIECGLIFSEFFSL